MCDHCGCEADGAVTVTRPPTQAHRHHHHHRHHGHGDGHHHDHRHDHEHAHDHDHAHEHGAEPRRIELQQAVLARNDELARVNRARLAERGVRAFNLVSSPGAGKTTLLERLCRDLAGERALCVIEGDQATERDAARIAATGVDVVQVNTGAGCHLDASMIARALDELDPPEGALLLIENVGNLVCPALFDLGERAKVLVASTTEGSDKPLKYPHMFRAAQLALVNKIDLLPHLDFDVEAFAADARRVQPDLELMHVSATTGEGLDAWYRWLLDS